MVQAMASFESEAAAAAVTTTSALPNSLGNQGALAVGPNVVNMVEILKQFDANGNQIANFNASTASNSQLQLSYPLDLNAILAAPGK